MRILHRIIPVAAGFGLASSLACGAEPTSRSEPAEVRNGDSGAGWVNRVFLIVNALTEAKTGSSVNVKYKRCLLTAAHVVSNPIQGNLVYRGVDLQNLDAKAYQNVANGAIHPGPLEPWRDLAVLWATNFLTPPAPPGGGSADAGVPPAPAPDPRILLSQWSPQTMIDSIGLGNAQLSAELAPQQPSTGAPKAVTIAGYGANGTNAQGDDTGADVLRIGQMDATHYFDTTAQALAPATTGGAYYLQAKVGENEAGCPGDSGGPAVTSAGVFGVMSLADGDTCATTDANFVTALNRAKVGQEESNWDWVHKTIARVCTKVLRTGVSGQGKVTGTLAPGQEFVEDDALNNTIRCGNLATNQADCIENVHENQGITLTATPGAGWRFVRWYQAGSHCQCHDSTSTTCGISYGAMGTYTVDDSDDTEACFAEFEQIPASGGDGGVG